MSTKYIGRILAAVSLRCNSEISRIFTPSTLRNRFSSNNNNNNNKNQNELFVTPHKLLPPPRKEMRA